jgi:plasmid stability protein
MGQVTVRELDDVVIERLKARAAGNHRSLEAELREILGRAAHQVDVATARASAAAMRRTLVGRVQGDSADLLREDRDR